MIFFNYTKPKMIVADEGKHIRAINDVYTPETRNENGEITMNNTEIQMILRLL